MNINNRKKYTIISYLILISLLLYVSVLAIKYDITSKGPMGDQAAHAMQALSLANEFDLKYDERDGVNWANLGWSIKPQGLFYQQYSGGYAFAKPYGYSLFLAPFLFFMGNKGFMASNICILWLTTLFVFLTINAIYNKLESTILTISFIFFSYAYLYIFTVHSDLFLAMLCSIFIFILTKLHIKFNKVTFIILSVLSAFIVVDKIVFILLIFPVIVQYFFKIKSVNLALVFIVIFVVSSVVCALPYLYYSDYKSWNPYGGDRYYLASNNKYPFSTNNDQLLLHGNPLKTKENFKPSQIYEKIFTLEKIKDQALSLYYYFIGSLTGIIVFIPIASVVILLAVYRIFFRFDYKCIVPLASVLFYILFYVILFPSNYYGGIQSLGNRYFLQMFPFVILILLKLKLSDKNIIKVVTISFLLSALFLYRHHFEPQSAFANIVRRGFSQKMMPYEKNQAAYNSSYISNLSANLNLYPWPPQNILIRSKINTITTGNKTFSVLLNKYKKKGEFYKISDMATFLRKSLLNGKTVLLNEGFYRSERSLVWSKKESLLLMKNSGKIETLKLGAILPDNIINVSVFNTHLHSEAAPFSIDIDTSKYKDDWIVVRFKADKSSVPDNDTRQLSFYISKRNI